MDKLKQILNKLILTKKDREFLYKTINNTINNNKLIEIEIPAPADVEDEWVDVTNYLKNKIDINNPQNYVLVHTYNFGTKEYFYFKGACSSVNKDYINSNITYGYFDNNINVGNVISIKYEYENNTDKYLIRWLDLS